MKDLLKSASKIVFIGMAMGSIAGLFTGFITNEQFINLALMAFAFYFTNKPTDTNGNITK